MVTQLMIGEVSRLGFDIDGGLGKALRDAQIADNTYTGVEEFMNKSLGNSASLLAGFEASKKDALSDAISKTPDIFGINMPFL